MDKPVVQEKEVERTQEVKDMDELLEESQEVSAEFVAVEPRQFKHFRDELFKKTNFVTALTEQVQEQIVELNEKTERIIKFRKLSESLKENSEIAYYNVNSVGKTFNELHRRLSELAKDSDFVDAGGLLKILNEFNVYQIDESVFVEEIKEVDVNTDYK